jgi:hypothetical protein
MTTPILADAAPHPGAPAVPAGAADAIGAADATGTAGAARPGVDLAGENVLVLADRLFAWADSRQWSGPDPYDGLTGRLGRLAVHPRLRQAVLQAVKRSPLDLRPVLGIQPLRTATAIGVAASACARIARLPVWGDRAIGLGSWTAGQQMTGTYAGLWRYEFDVQTRWSYYPASVPNLVATTFCAEGCLDSETLDAARARRLGEALLCHLFRDGYFTYTPTSRVLIHNANLMGAALAVRLAGQDGLPPDLAGRLRAAARSALAVSLAGQRRDGSWPYGEGSRLGWVDNFHTGYVLLRLEQAATALELDVSGPLERGVGYYFAHLFDGPVPRYLADRDPRRDPNNEATAVRMAAWAVERGYRPLPFAAEVLATVLDGFSVNALGARAGGHARPVWASPRWSVAPLLDALTAYGAVAGQVTAAAQVTTA